MTAPHPLTPPAIGQPWPGQGGIYAGIARGRDGQPDHHLVLATIEPTGRLAWKAAMAWAQGVEVEDHSDFTLPDRFECSVLFGNVGDLFKQDWHWSRSEYAESASYAWSCNFNYGGVTSHKSFEGRARAVRRLPVDSSIPSIQAEAA